MIDEEELVRLWRVKPLLTIGEISSRLGKSLPAVYRRARKLGLEYRTTLRRVVIKPDIVYAWMKSNKQTQKAASRKFGCSEAHLCRVMRKWKRERERYRRA